jgi:hypothetical protein
LINGIEDETNMYPIIDDAHHCKQNLTPYASPIVQQMLTFWLVLLVFGTTWAMPLRAQDDASHATDMLIAGEMQTVMVNAETMVMLTYEAPEAQWVQITTRAHTPEGDDLPVDTILIVRSDDEDVLAYVDDTLIVTDDATSEGGIPTLQNNARISALYLPSTGDYTVSVDSFNGVSEGAVDVTLFVVDAFNPMPIEDIENEDAESSDAENSIAITLPPARAYQQSITLGAGEALLISARDVQGDIDPILTLYDGAGAMLAQNDDHQSLLDDVPEIAPDLTLNNLDARLFYRNTSDQSLTLMFETRDFLGRTGTIHLKWRIFLPDEDGL